jgi:hypothetical protein|tara:strand:- start:229 stop:750 length:522 start_codon:yes stop_codon:yes gene_type:complete
MLKTLKVYVQHVLDSNCGFGVDIDGGERIFVPPNLVFKYGLSEGTCAQMRVIPNSSIKANHTKYQAVGIIAESVTHSVDAGAVYEKDAPRVIEARMEDRVLSLLSEPNNQYAHRAADIADKLDAENDEVQAALGKLHRDGEIWEAKICRLGTQKKASYCLWALDDDWFIPEFE